MSTVPPRLLYATSIVVLIVLIWLGSRNHPDPVWQEADQIVRSPCWMLDDAVDSINLYYAQLHKRPVDATGYALLSKPHLRTLSWPKFRQFCDEAVQSRFLVVSGVTGTGATKIAEKAAAFIATDPVENVLTIHCSPEFDLDLHKKYIGFEDENQAFHQGVLLDFWDRCRAHPQQRFVCVIDNFDKINPETFFGPELWEHLSSPKEKAILGEKVVEVPKNFLLLSVTHLGPGSRNEFMEEHLKRLGRRYVIEPNACELLDYLDKEARELIAKAKGDTGAVKEQLNALLGMRNRRRMVFYFLKSNALVRKRYGPGFELGQGSNLRSFYMPEATEGFKNTYLVHINAIRGVKPLRMTDFADVDYTVKTEGLEPHTNYFDRQINWLSETGYLVEITMVAATALLTTLIGYWIFRRREKLIRNYGALAQDVYDQFEAETISAEEASRQLESIKNEVNNLVLKRKLNYTEALYFIAFVDDKVRRVDYARSVSENFMELFYAFTEDNVLTEKEYNKLCQFLQSIRHKIPEDSFRNFMEKVEWAYKNLPHAENGK